MSEIKLLPCPFCGSKLHKHYRYYHHEINGCLFDDYAFFEEDFDKWNTRKPMERIVEQLEEEKEIYEKEADFWTNHSWQDSCYFNNWYLNDSKMECLDDAIDIVRNGGKE